MLAIDGIDGVFIGPADLSASMGHVGNAAHPEVQAAIEDAILRIRKAGKAPGILTADVFGSFGPVLSLRYAGVTMCSIFFLGLLALPFAPETKCKPLPE